MLALQMAVLALAAGGSDARLLDFYADWCGPCKRMDSTVHQLAEAGYPVSKINIDQNRALAAKHHVQAIPCFVLTVNGEEVDRLEGPCTLNELKRMFEKARPSRDGAAAFPVAAASGQAPALTTPFTRDAGPAAKGPGISAELLQRLMAASVRLKIDDAQGHSFGSGTIIDARDGEALILTCGHVFRDSQGKGPISVDLFGPGAPQGLAGELIDYDLKSDVGLVAIRTTEALVGFGVGPSGLISEAGVRVVSIGCVYG
ncbi:MAG: thioredoxin domain-containing protein [Pirellulales bacterium]